MVRWWCSRAMSLSSSLRGVSRSQTTWLNLRGVSRSQTAIGWHNLITTNLRQIVCNSTRASFELIRVTKRRELDILQFKERVKWFVRRARFTLGLCHFAKSLWTHSSMSALRSILNYSKTMMVLLVCATNCGNIDPDRTIEWHSGLQCGENKQCNGGGGILSSSTTKDHFL